MSFIAAGVLLACTASRAVAQADADLTQRLQRQLRQIEQQSLMRVNPELSIGERALIDYGVVATFGFLAVDDTQQRTRILRQTDVQAFAYANIDGGAHEAFGRLRFTYQDFEDGDSFDGTGDGLVDPLSDRYWYKFDLRRAIEAYQGRYSKHNLRLQVGRQYVHWASGLAFSDQLYAARVWFEFDDWFELEGLVGTTPASTVVDFDASRPSFDGDTKRDYIGGRITLTAIENHRPYFYTLIQRDRNDQDFFIIPAAPGFAFPTRFHYDSEYWAIGSTGSITPKLSYEIEGIYQTGENLSNPVPPFVLPAIPQTEEDIEAWAARGLLRYDFFDEQFSRIEVEAIYTTGDDDRALDTSNTFGGNTTGTDDNAFNSLGFANTGLAYAAPLSNLTMVRLGGSTYPLRSLDDNLFRRFQIGADGFFFFKSDPQAPLDEPTSQDSFLGWEIDGYVNWRLTSDLAVFARYGVFFPGAAIADDGDARHFFYSGVTYSF